MNIEIHDMALEARIQKRVQSTGSGSIEEVLLRLLEIKRSRIGGWRTTVIPSTRRFSGASSNWIGVL